MVGMEMEEDLMKMVGLEQEVGEEVEMGEMEFVLYNIMK